MSTLKLVLAQLFLILGVIGFGLSVISLLICLIIIIIIHKKIASFSVKLTKLQRDIQNLSATKAIILETAAEKKLIHEPRNNQNVVDEHGQRKLENDNNCSDATLDRKNKKIIQPIFKPIYLELPDSADENQISSSRKRVRICNY